jgi:large subunit ribosomal protein L15
VDEAVLREAGLVRGTIDGIKILGVGELTKAFTITADKASESAKAKIAKAGGSLTLK